MNEITSTAGVPAGGRRSRIHPVTDRDEMIGGGFSARHRVSAREDVTPDRNGIPDADWMANQGYEPPDGVNEYCWYAWEALRRNVYFQRGHVRPGIAEDGGWDVEPDLSSWGLVKFKHFREAYTNSDDEPHWSGIRLVEGSIPLSPLALSRAGGRRNVAPFVGPRLTVDVHEWMRRVGCDGPPTALSASLLGRQPMRRRVENRVAETTVDVSKKTVPSRSPQEPGRSLRLESDQVAVVLDLPKLLASKSALRVHIALMEKHLQALLERKRSENALKNMESKVVSGQGLHRPTVSRLLRLADAMLAKAPPSNDELADRIFGRLEGKKMNEEIKKARELIYGGGYLRLASKV